MNAQYFYDFFSNIPSEKWITANFSEGVDKHCAYGHLGIRECNDFKCNIDANILSVLFAKHNKTVTGVNDGYHKDYQQANPKERILSALKNIIDYERDNC